MANEQNGRRRIPTLFSGAADEISGSLNAMGENVVGELREVRSLLASMDDRLAKIREEGTPTWIELPNGGGAVVGAGVWTPAYSSHVRVRVTGLWVSALAPVIDATLMIEISGTRVPVSLGLGAGLSAPSSKWIPFEGLLSEGGQARYMVLLGAVSPDQYIVNVKGWADA